MKKITKFLLLFFFLSTHAFATVFEDLQKKKNTPYLDFILMKIEYRLIQRHSTLKPQAFAMRIQYQTVVTEVNFSKKESKIFISIIGVMDKERYKSRKYKPKISDCNVLRNILVYGKYGYNLIFQKRNKFLTNEDMEDIFVSRYLNNLTLSDKEKNYILKNTFAKVEIIDPVRGNDIFCKGKISEDLK